MQISMIKFIKWVMRISFCKEHYFKYFGKIKFSKFCPKDILPFAISFHIRLNIIFQSSNRDLRIKEFNFLRELNFPNFKNWQFSTNFCKNWFSWTEPKLAKFMKFNRFLLNFIVSYCFSFFLICFEEITVLKGLFCFKRFICTDLGVFQLSKASLSKFFAFIKVWAFVWEIHMFRTRHVLIQLICEFFVQS